MVSTIVSSPPTPACSEATLAARIAAHCCPPAPRPSPGTELDRRVPARDRRGVPRTSSRPCCSRSPRRAARRDVQHLQHVLDRRRPAHPRVRAAAGARRVASPGAALGRARGLRRRRGRLRHRPRRRLSASRPASRPCSPTSSSCRPACWSSAPARSSPRWSSASASRSSPASPRRCKASRVGPAGRAARRRGRPQRGRPCGVPSPVCVVRRRRRRPHADRRRRRRGRPRRARRARHARSASCCSARSSPARSAAVLGAPIAALRGRAGRLARRNAMRNPRRTAATASALMVGVAVVAVFTVLGASIKAVDRPTPRTTRCVADLVVAQDEHAAAPGSTRRWCRRCSSCPSSRPSSAAAIGVVHARRRRPSTRWSSTPPDARRVADMEVHAGFAGDAAATTGLAVSARLAERPRLDDRLRACPVTFADGSTSTT